MKMRGATPSKATGAAATSKKRARPDSASVKRPAPATPKARKATRAVEHASPLLRRRGPAGFGKDEESHQRRTLETAQGLISKSVQDPEMLAAIVQQPDVAEFVRRSLLQKTSRDAAFAASVAAAAPAIESRANVPAAAAASLAHSAGAGSPAGSLARALSRSQGRSPGAAVGVAVGAGGAVTAPRTPQPAQSESPPAGTDTTWRSVVLEAMVSAMGRAEARPGVAPDWSCRLQDAMAMAAGISGSRRPPGGAAALGRIELRPAAAQDGTGEPLLKRRRRLSKSSPGPAAPPRLAEPAAACAAAGSFSSLSLELIALSMSFVDVRTKVLGVRAASRNLHQAMQGHCAWDPLHLDKDVGRAFLRLLKRRDPLGCFLADVTRTKRILPRGLFEVRRLEAVLMDPERVEAEQSDTEDDTPKPRPLVIADPLDEVCKRLRHYFASVTELAISNIEDYRMDYRFVGLRASSLAEFGFVELVHRPTTPPTYALLACRDEPPRCIDLEAIRAENRLRLPSNAGFDERTTISEREALYLSEHRSAYKNGDDFHLAHAFYRTVRSHGVRKRYKAVVAALRKRFPHRFASKGDPNSPCRSRSLLDAQSP